MAIGFGTGKGPIAPATWGTAAALAIYWALQFDGDSAWFFIITAAVIVIGAAAAEAESRVTPIDDLRGSALHRKSMVRVLTQRTLERAVDMARKVPMPFELQRSLAVQAVF